MESMFKGISKIRTITLLILLMLVRTGVYAQKQMEIRLQLIEESDLKLPTQVVKPIFFKKDQRVVQGHLELSKNKLKMVVPGRPSVELPYSLETLISEDGETMLQYGDESDMSHPTRTNLFWLDHNGRIKARTLNYYIERAFVSMSDDGFTIVAGGLFGNREQNACGLYSPTGEKIWEFILSDGQRAAKVTVGPEGKHSILVTTDAVDWLNDHQIHILNSKGEMQNSFNNFKIIQKMTIVDKGQHLFVQGYDQYGLIRISDGNLLWIKKGKIRMISPFGAKMSPDGESLFILLADFDGKPKQKYRWNLVVHNTTDGSKIHSSWLPNKYPSTWNRVFEQISSDRLTILAGQKRFDYSWQKGRR